MDLDNLRFSGQPLKQKTTPPSSAWSSLVRRGGGIRTPGTFRFNGFQDRRIRPLCHSSVFRPLPCYPPKERSVRTKVQDRSKPGLVIANVAVRANLAKSHCGNERR